MDALKILCRSTTISRKNSKQPAQLSRPSTGEARNPQLFGNGITEQSPVDANESKKRKRHESNASSQQDDELDFFGDRKKTTKRSSAEDASGRRREQEESKNSVKEQEYEEIKVNDIPEDECRRILKSHKIKITLLWPSQEDQAALPAKRRKHEENKEKESRIQGAKKKKRKLDIIPQPLTSFAQLLSRYGLDSQLARNIEEQGYKIPTEVQLGALPILLKSWKTRKSQAELAAVQNEKATSSRHAEQEILPDLLAVAPTGSGKTLAFLIPVLSAISQRKASRKKSTTHDSLDAPSAIIVAPTKELAAQIVNEASKLARKTGVTILRARKGMHLSSRNDSEADQVNQGNNKSTDFTNSGDEASPPNPRLHRDRIADILVTTPLTLVNALDANKSSTNALENVRHLVLDEADVLLDPMFRSQTLKIWESCTRPKLQVSLWSATMGSNIEDLTRTTILDHRRNTSTATISQAEPQIVRLVVGLKDSAIPSVQHELIYCANEAGKLLAMRQLLRPRGIAPSPDSPAIHAPFLVFTQTIPRAIALASELRYDIPAQASASSVGEGGAVVGTDRLAVLHADLSDSARANIMARFRAAEIWVLITTDLLARGVDFRGVNAVVNYDIPTSSAAYVHRVGRTGRAGREGGVAVTLYAEEDVPVMKNVVNVVKAAEGVGRRTQTHATQEQTRDWLLSSLPKVSKREKQRLKQRGVEARRANPAGKVVDQRLKARTRISTKSGYDRRLDNKRKSVKVVRRGSPTVDKDDA